MSVYEEHEAAVRAALLMHGRVSHDEVFGRIVCWSVEVYCQEPSHTEKRWEIGTFILEDLGPNHPLNSWLWRPRAKRHRAGKGNRERERLWRASEDKLATPGPQILIGDTPLPQNRDYGSSPNATRWRYPLKCGSCGLSLPWSDRSIDVDTGESTNRGADRLQIELDKLAIAGAPDVPLSRLVAKLT